MVSILQDGLREDLKEEDAKIVVQQVFDFTTADEINRARAGGRVKSFAPAKSLNDFYVLIKESLNDYENRLSVPEENRVIFTEEDPDVNSDTETITFSLVKREPGAFGQGAPFESNVRNLRPIIREEGEDPQNPGYRFVVHGYWYDNVVRLTCWARTNKRANYRSIWLEDMMEEYSWWFKLQGVDRVLFWGRQTDLTVERDGNKWYGRPIDFFVRTEKLRVFSEKKIEEILIKLAVKKE